MGLQPKLCIDASGDQVMVAGARGVMEKAFDLPWMPYIEIDGIIIARVYDPVADRGIQTANAAVRRMRCGGL